MKAVKTTILGPDNADAIEAAERDRITAIIVERLLGWLREVDYTPREKQGANFTVAKELQHIIDLIKPRDGCDAAQPAKDASSAT